MLYLTYRTIPRQDLARCRVWIVLMRTHKTCIFKLNIITNTHPNERGTLVYYLLKVFFFPYNSYMLQYCKWMLGYIYKYCPRALDLPDFWGNWYRVKKVSYDQNDQETSSLRFHAVWSESCLCESLDTYKSYSKDFTCIRKRIKLSDWCSHCSQLRSFSRDTNPMRRDRTKRHTKTKVNPYGQQRFDLTRVPRLICVFGALWFFVLSRLS